MRKFLILVVFAVFISQTFAGNCVCTKIWQPVCGKDGKTYGNNCEAQCANVKVIKKGGCTK